MAGCHNSPRGAFLLLLLSLLPVPPPPSPPPPKLRRRAVLATPVLEDNFSKSRSPALIALMMNEASQPAKRWKPHAALYMGCRRALPLMCATLAARCEFERECAYAATAAAMRRPRATVVMMKTIVEKNGKFSAFT